MERNYLEALYDNRKSFYKKAHISWTGSTIFLTSYTTLVANIDKGEFELMNIDEHSMTTRRHVREFARQYGKLDQCDELYEQVARDKARERARLKREQART